MSWVCFLAPGVSLFLNSLRRQSKDFILIIMYIDHVYIIYNIYKSKPNYNIINII